MNLRRVQNVALGATIGLIGGLIQGGLVSALNGSGSVGQIVGAGSPAAGWVIHLVLAVLMGAIYALLFKPVPGGEAESLMNGAAFGVLWWLVIPVTLAWLLAGGSPAWSTAAAAASFPALLGYLYQGAIVGAGYHLLSALAVRWWGPVPGAQPPEIRQRIVILGGGFSGVKTARRLERLFWRDPSVQITLVSNVNYMLFTPMLTEVTASGIEPRHIAPTLRAFFHRARVIRGEVEDVDLARQVVHLTPTEDGSLPDIPYDHLFWPWGPCQIFTA